jgi:hypothetical protein
MDCAAKLAMTAIALSLRGVFNEAIYSLITKTVISSTTYRQDSKQTLTIPL